MYFFSVCELREEKQVTLACGKRLRNRVPCFVFKISQLIHTLFHPTFHLQLRNLGVLLVSNSIIRCFLIIKLILVGNYVCVTLKLSSWYVKLSEGDQKIGFDFDNDSFCLLLVFYLIFRDCVYSVLFEQSTTSILNMDTRS